MSDLNLCQQERLARYIASLPPAPSETRRVDASVEATIAGYQDQTRARRDQVIEDLNNRFRGDQNGASFAGLRKSQG